MLLTKVVNFVAKFLRLVGVSANTGFASMFLFLSPLEKLTRLLKLSDT